MLPNGQRRRIKLPSHDFAKRKENGKNKREREIWRVWDSEFETSCTSHFWAWSIKCILMSTGQGNSSTRRCKKSSMSIKGQKCVLSKSPGCRQAEDVLRVQSPSESPPWLACADRESKTMVVYSHHELVHRENMLMRISQERHTHEKADPSWGLCTYDIVLHFATQSFGDRAGWLPLNFGIHDVMRTAPLQIPNHTGQSWL